MNDKGLVLDRSEVPDGMTVAAYKKGGGGVMTDQEGKPYIGKFGKMPGRHPDGLFPYETHVMPTRAFTAEEVALDEAHWMYVGGKLVRATAETSSATLVFKDAEGQFYCMDAGGEVPFEVESSTLFVPVNPRRTQT